MKRKKLISYISSAILLCFASSSQAAPVELKLLKDAYPDLIQDVSSQYIDWKDGARTRVRSSYSFFESFFGHQKYADGSISIKDLQCDSYESLFKKMYGGSAAQVKQKLVTLYWMPHVFGKQYPMRVTTVNGVDKKIERISAELEKLPPSYYKFLANPGGSFYWRNVKRENYLSAHSFGIAIDINSHYGNYWLWDLEKSKRPIAGVRLTPHNNIPMKIVEIFEQEGFLWGGRWYFYDTMHFEYRPEMFTRQAGLGLQYNKLLGMRCAV